ncbi:hypothetical protein [Nitrosovibrio sp. Nv17]|jgi:hypothetical protein|uniref:hypothetical protein n=1 Tax=Nitrosovibrio sp. Nv17 TaxID=1855339 RepID=UPI000908CC75|nr:hypothetical protein [Nitrosovibrio sp. Nv17]SFW19700.1 hypothetical protein SAMN05216414_10566 [Nitrosovibrio sp. Nv17]
MASVEDLESEEQLANAILGDVRFSAYVDERVDYTTVDAGDGMQMRVLTSAGLRAIGRRILDSEEFKAVFARAGGARKAICDEFAFCRKLEELGRFETAKMLFEFLKGSMLASGVAVVLLDPSFLLPVCALLSFYVLVDLCGCKPPDDRKLW